MEHEKPLVMMIELELYTMSEAYIGTVEVPINGSIADIKEEIEEKYPELSASRQSIRLTIGGKDEKDSSTCRYLGLTTGSKLFIKDLGPQVSWKLVFLMEYVGPIIIYLYFFMRPMTLYGRIWYPYSPACIVAVFCWCLHYIKRTVETMYVHRFSHKYMPRRNLFKNCAYYWGFTAYIGYFLNTPKYISPPILLTLVGFIIFFIGELGNLKMHLMFRKLRPEGTSIRRILMPDGSVLASMINYVSCPNYFYEIMAWLGFTLMTASFPALLFTFAGFYQMSVWAKAKHAQYLREFPDYPADRTPIIPFIRCEY